MEISENQERSGNPAAELFYAKKTISTAMNTQLFDEAGQRDRAREDAAIKQRVQNFVSVYLRHYPLPKILPIFENTPEIEKTARQITRSLGGEYDPEHHPNVYLIQEVGGSSRLISARMKKSFFRGSHPDLSTQKDLPDEEWTLRSGEMINALVNRVPGLKEELFKLEDTDLKQVREAELRAKGH